MLELRPNCEHCGKRLSPNSNEAMICSFECTFCKDCVTTELEGVCPNCGGNFCARPIRPSQNWKNNNYLGAYPASSETKHRPVEMEAHRKLVSKVKGVEFD